MNEELCHRNMAFSLYQADEMPQMKMGESTVEALGGSVYRVRLEIRNPKVTPTIMAKAAENNVVRPDLLTVRDRVSSFALFQVSEEEIRFAKLEQGGVPPGPWRLGQEPGSLQPASPAFRDPTTPAPPVDPA